MGISGYSSGLSSRGRVAEGRGRRLAFRVVATANLIAGALYIGWRYGASINTSALALGLLLVIAESYGFLDSILFALTMWKPARRSSPPPLEEASVDVFITTYNESVDVVRLTAQAAVAIEWSPLVVHILDDGSREEMRELASSLGCAYITRGEEWKGKDRHAKAGNVNNALSLTSGDFILILDADQIPDPRIVRQTIGYFADQGLALVQTPQSFYNLPPGDPFGSDAPLFYGPIMRGKDGWNAAFFCGSNALLRREALMQVGIQSYAEAAEAALNSSLKELRREARHPLGGGAAARSSARSFRKALAAAKRSLGAGESLQAVSEALKEAYEAYIAAGGSELSGGGDFGLSRKEEALAVEGVSTLSITEDMATALRLHASGWKSVFHSEVLAQGLAPEDLGASLVQRLRWAQGTIQVLVRDSPLTKKGLSFGQRLMYFSTIFSYFSGFANLIFVFCPLVFFFSGIAPIRAWNLDFFLRFIPFFILNRLAFIIAAEGIRIRRGEQYNLALFPVWIKAVLGVFSGRKISFAVTPKSRQSGNFLPLVRVQIGVIALTLAGMAFAALGLALGWRRDLFGVLVNAGWACYNIWQFLVIVRAARYAPPTSWNPQPPRYEGSERSMTR
jgi:cellulose synthase (UDP-forming)